jgi:hypothetical protein
MARDKRTLFVTVQLGLFVLSPFLIAAVVFVQLSGLTPLLPYERAALRRFKHTCRLRHAGSNPVAHPHGARCTGPAGMSCLRCRRITCRVGGCSGDGVNASCSHETPQLRLILSETDGGYLPAGL